MLQIIIWLLAVCMMIFVLNRKLAPVYTDETLNAAHFITTPELLPGDAVTQSFTSSYDKLTNVDVALCYDADISENAAALIQVLREDTVIVQQPLSVRSCPNSSFLSLSVKTSDCLGDHFTIRVENISDPSDNTSFTLMATDKEYLYLDNTSNYEWNGLSSSSRILCRFTYQTGYSYYPALTYAFWVFLAALIVTGLLSRLWDRLLPHSGH
ncbi:MAG: hypothetical protein J1E64_03570 [Acetatifactor sp.]|nr:hypothetical protein [Acetatifactor sp.]